MAGPLARLEPLRHVEAGVLEVAYFKFGPAQYADR